VHQFPNRSHLSFGQKDLKEFLALNMCEASLGHGHISQMNSMLWFTGAIAGIIFLIIFFFWELKTSVLLSVVNSYA